MEYLNKLTHNKLGKLLRLISIKPFETDEYIILNSCISIYDNRLHILHGRDSDGDLIETVLTDFYVEKIYGFTPSLYDQVRFQETMKNLCSTESEKQDYENKVKCSNAKLFPDLKEIVEGDFGNEDEDEYCEDDEDDEENED